MTIKPIHLHYEGKAWDRWEGEWLDLDGQVTLGMDALEDGVPGHIERHVIAQDEEGKDVLIFGDTFFLQVQMELRRKLATIG